MSYDLAVFFAANDFPFQTWLSVIGEIGVTHDDTRPEDEPHLGLRHWRTSVDDSSVFTTLYTLEHPDFYGVADTFRWRLGVYANSGCSPAARWAQFSIPYRCISFMELAIAYDPQSGTVFDSPDAYWDFASKAIARWPALARKLRRAGLMTDAGILALDRPPNRVARGVSAPSPHTTRRAL